MFQSTGFQQGRWSPWGSVPMRDTFLVAALGEKGAVSILWVEAVLRTAPHRCRPDVPVGRLRTVHGWEGGTGPAERVFLGPGGTGSISWLVDSRPCPIRAHRGAHRCEGGQGSADRVAFCCELGRRGVRLGRPTGCRPRRWDRVCEGPLHAQEPEQGRQLSWRQARGSPDRWAGAEAGAVEEGRCLHSCTHRYDGLTSQHKSVSPGAGGGKSEVEEWAGLVSSEPLSMECRRLSAPVSSRRGPSGRVCVLISSSYRNTSPIGLRPTLMTSFYLNPLSLSHSEVLGLGLQHVNFGGKAVVSTTRGHVHCAWSAAVVGHLGGVHRAGCGCKQRVQTPR